jgi:hypothetical protein
VSEYGIEDIIQELVPLIRETLIDGQRKRSPSYWKEDPGHEDALQRHLHRVDRGEIFDADSGAPAWSHVGTRALMLAWQQERQISRKEWADFAT